MASEITHCLIQIDIIGAIEAEEMTSDEMLIYFYCLTQGAKSNMGIFIDSRYDIAKKLKIDHDITYLFFEKFTNVVGFCDDAHLIWCKSFFGRVDLGLMKDVWIVENDEKTGRTKNSMQKATLYNKNRFVEKINSNIKKPMLSKSGKMFFFKKHWMFKEWIERNRCILEMVNEEVKSVKGNNRNLDLILSLAKEEE